MMLDNIFGTLSVAASDFLESEWTDDKGESPSKSILPHTR